MTKIMSAEEWVDKTYGTDLDPKEREMLAFLAPLPGWVKAAGPLRKGGNVRVRPQH